MKAQTSTFGVLPAIAVALLFQASCLVVKAQDTAQNGALYIGVPGGSLVADEGVTTGDLIGPANSYGGYVFSWVNPAAGGASFSSHSWGAEYFAAGSVATNSSNPGVYTTLDINGTEVEYQVTSYIGPQYVPAPGVNDTALFTPIATDNLFSAGIPVSELTTQGIGNGQLTDGYFYAGTGVASTSYTVNLGSSTVAQTVVEGGTWSYAFLSSDGSNDLVNASPNFVLGGTYTSTNDAILESPSGTPINFSGSGTFATANLGISGPVNVNGGTLQGDETYIGNTLPAIFVNSTQEIAAPYQGTQGASPTTLTVTGSSSVLNASTYLVIGDTSNQDSATTTGPTVLSLMNGASANTGDVYLSDGAAGTEADLLINGSTFTSTGFVDVGELDNTIAKVTISNGGKLSDTIGAIGFGNNAQASVTVTGSGSTWNNTSYVDVGYSGTSVIDYLTVTAGGAVNSLNFMAVGGQVQEGTSGNGDLFITAGGKVVSGTNVPAQSLAAAVGFGTNSTGIVMIDGSGSSWDIKQRLSVGYSSGSNGTITVQNGATLQVEGDIVRLGRVEGSTGSITFTGTGSSFNFTTADSQLIIGDAGTGNFNVQGGAQISESAAVIIGNQSTGEGYATVQGANSSWTINNSLVIGESGIGTLSILNGDKVTVQQGQNVILGDQADSLGVLILNGAGSALSVTQASSGLGGGDALEIGNHGVGNLEIENGASITFEAAVNLGYQTDGTGEISVDGSSGGTPSTATFNGGILTVGYQSAGGGSTVGGLLSITGGGQAMVSASHGIIVGDVAGSTGEIDVDGAGSKLTVSGSDEIEIGVNGTGTLNVTNGGKFDGGNTPLSVGVSGGPVYTTSTVNIVGTGTGASGSGQTQFTTGNVTIGDQGYGALNASQGAQLTTNGNVLIGSAATALGTVTLDTKSVWNVTGSLAVGLGGTGNLTVEGGAMLNTTQYLYIESGDGAATVTVTGDASTLKANNISLGGIGSDNTLSIKNGGQVSTQAFSFGSHSSTLTVDGKSSSGAPSTLTIGALTLEDASSGSSTITVSNGGLLTVNGASFQTAGTFANSTINITGAGSKLDASAAYTNLTDGVNINIMDGGALVTGETDIQTGNASIQLNSTAAASTWDITGPFNIAYFTLGLTNNSTVTVSGAASMQHGTFTLNGSGASFKAPSLQVAEYGTLAVNGLSQVLLDTTLSVNASGTVDVTGGGSVQVANPSNAPNGAVGVGAMGLLVNNGTINGNVNVDLGGSYVSVSGVVHGKLTIAGLNKPIDAPGIETVDGDYEQTSTGVLDIGVEGTVAGSPTGYSVVDVTGNATLDGTLELSYLNGYKPTVGETLDFLNVTGTTTGAFTAVTLSGVPTLTISDTLVNGVLTITSVARDYTNPALVAQLSPNQQAVGTSLNSAANGATGDFNTVLTSIDNLGTAQQVGQAFDQLSPQRLELFRNIAFDNYAFFSQQLDDHLANLRDGMTGLDTTGFAFSDAALGSNLSQIKGHLLAWQPAPIPGMLSDTTDPVIAGLAMAASPFTPPPSRWSTFITGNVVLADLNASADTSASNYTTGGVTLGADYHLNQHWTVGALFGYNHTDANLDNQGSTATVDTYSPGIYAAFADHGWYANGSFNYGYNSYTENRTIVFPGVNRTAVGTPDGNQYSSDLDGGYEFHLGNWTIGPSAGLNYVHLDINSFSEGDAGAAGLNIQEQNADSLRSRIGFDTRWQTKYMKTDFTYHLSAHWQHEFMANSLGITSSLETPGISPFTVQSPGADRDSALLDAGLDVQVSSSADVFVDYQAEAGQSNFFAQSVQAGVKIGF